ncbi:YkgJ family cysteine cluster protein [Candidatus Bathyarchaeota archaeon A05DMB-5]|nr:YkgJ family cysteine cluster protein [Candidatus Bathyarchaeota archaeon A05DMB-5]
MLFVPWQYIADWKCNSCGICCRAYSVVLKFPEWLRIVKNYGVGATVSGLDKLFLKRKSDGSCIFLYSLSGMYLCGLQHMKPKACKLWPFKILGKPQYGYASDAVYSYGENQLFIYADSTCSGLRYGKPTLEFSEHTLKEFIEIALGTRNNQFKTTADLSFVRTSFHHKQFRLF